MKFEIMKNDQVIDRIEAPDETTAFNDAMELFDGDIDDVREVIVKPEITPEEAYTNMNKQIAKERELADVEEYYGWLRNNPLASVPLSIVAPSTVESIQEGKLPSPVDALIDVPLAASALLTAPVRGATVLGTVGKNALLGAGIGAGTEVALAGVHERDIDPRSVATSALFGGAGGAVAGGLQSRAKANLGKMYGAKEGAEYAFEKLNAPSIGFPKGGSAQDRTLARMASDIEKTVPEARLEMTGIINNPEDFLSGVNDAVNQSLKRSVILSDISGADLSRKQKLLADFNQNVLGMSSLADNILPLPAALDEAMALYRKDPELGKAVINELEPMINTARSRNLSIASLGEESPVDGLVRIPEVKESTRGLLDKMRYAQTYDEAVRSAKSPTFEGSITKLGVDKAKDILKSPEAAVGASRVAQSAGIRVAPRPINKAARDEYGRATDEEGNILYAPEGQRGWDWLWNEAEKVKKGKK